METTLSSFYFDFCLTYFKPMVRFYILPYRIWTEYGETRSNECGSPNEGKKEPEKLRIQTLFTQCISFV